MLCETMLDSPPRITACVPYFRCNSHIRRAVESLLVQTQQNLRVVIINDGDPNPPWDCLADIDDSRLVRTTLTSNRGPYFATSVVLNATPDQYLLIQDADDWSAPGRVSRLLSQMMCDRSDFAF